MQAGVSTYLRLCCNNIACPFAILSAFFFPPTLVAQLHNGRLIRSVVEALQLYPSQDVLELLAKTVKKNMEGISITFPGRFLQ